MAFRRHISGQNRVIAFVAAVAAFLCAEGVASASQVPDDQRAWLEIRGAGVSPSSEIVLSTGEKNSIVVRSDKNGQFSFKKLDYYSFVPLKFRLDIPAQKTKMVSVGKTSLSFDLNPMSSTVDLSGEISPAGNIVVNIDGVQSDSRIAGGTGAFKMRLRTPLGLADGTSQLTANIINVGETCCPKLLVPSPPIQLTVSSTAIPRNAAPSRPSGSTAPPVSAPVPYTTAPKAVPESPSRTAPVTPEKAEPQKDDQQQKKKIPYLVTGSLSQELRYDLPDVTAAAKSVYTVPSYLYEQTYVGGFKKLADQARNAIMTDAMMIGAFLDGRATLNSLSKLQKLNAETMKAYAVSDSICKFGTLSTSIAGSEALMDANKQALSKIIVDRATQRNHSIYGDAIQGGVDRINHFKGKYCETVDSNNGLKGYCTSSASPEYFNRDVDFTRVFDVPLTLNVNFTDNTLTSDEENIIALFDNLTLRNPELDVNGKNFAKPNKTNDMQNLRRDTAVQELVGNSFANLVAMKASGTGKSTTYMKNVVQKLGLSADDATKFIGSNPSYFAQMEVLTKMLYQDPSFYTGLYDTPANVARQRVAIKAISLMQDRDLLESLKRRELLLSALIQMKLRKEEGERRLQGISSD